MAITAPAYNPELSNDRSTHLVSRMNLKCEMEQRPTVSTDLSQIQFLSLVGNQVELAEEINRQKIKVYLNQFKINKTVLDRLVEKPSYVDYLYHIQHTIPNYFSNFTLKLDYFMDPEENHESINVIVFSSLDLMDALDAEDLYFEKEFESIYNLTEGKFTFRVQPHGV